MVVELCRMGVWFCRVGVWHVHGGVVGCRVSEGWI